MPSALKFDSTWVTLALTTGDGRGAMVNSCSMFALMKRGFHPEQQGVPKWTRRQVSVLEQQVWASSADVVASGQSHSDP